MKKTVRAEQFNRRPGWIRALNATWQACYPLGARVSLDKDNLIREARRRCRLKNLGPDFWEEPLERLLQSIEAEAQLSPLGRFITRERLVNLLGVRLRAEYWFEKHPEILEQDLYPALIIAGLQRTGTTKLQRLLNTDPGNRLVMSWEAINPAPLGTDRREREKRIRQARLSEQALKVMAPGFFAIHPVEHLQPEEDVLLLDVSFMSTTAEATMNVPSYSRWLESTDQSPAYRYMIKLLKLLQWQQPGERWILKSPHHMEFFGEIQRLFPKAHFIWTHREPATCIPSFLSMVAHGRAIFSDEVTAEAVAGHWMRKISYMLEKGAAFRQAHPEALFSDIPYATFIADPLSEVRKIYEKEGLPFPPELRKRFLETEKEQDPDKYGKHQYSPEDFGLTEKSILDHTEKYRSFMETGRRGD